MGVPFSQEIVDPDDTYELTTDNAKKILAIYMRFRWVQLSSFTNEYADSLMVEVSSAVFFHKWICRQPDGGGEFSCLLSQMNICRQPDGGGEFSCLLSQMNMQTAWWWRWVQLSSFTNEYMQTAWWWRWVQLSSFTNEYMQTAWWWRWVQLSSFTNEHADSLMVEVSSAVFFHKWIYADSLMVDWFLISNALLTENVILGQNMVFQITQSNLLHFYDTTLCLNVIYYGKTWFIK